MPYESDRKPNPAYDRANIQTSKYPNLNVTEDDWAFLLQRADVPKDWKGVIDSQYVLGSIALEKYLDRPYRSNTTDITVKNGDRVLVSGNGNIQAWAATDGQWFTISDIGNKLKNFVPSVRSASGYTIEGKAEDLELNSIGSAWAGGEHDENILLFICDGSKNWRVGGQMKLSDLFPATSTPPPTPTTTTDTTPPRIVLLDEPEVEVVGGNLNVSIRTLLVDEGTSTTGGTATGGTMTLVRRTPARVTTAGEEPVRIQMRIEE